MQKKIGYILIGGAVIVAVYLIFNNKSNAYQYLDISKLVRDPQSGDSDVPNADGSFMSGSLFLTYKDGNGNKVTYSKAVVPNSVGTYTLYVNLNTYKYDENGNLIK